MKTGAGTGKVGGEEVWIVDPRRLGRPCAGCRGFVSAVARRADFFRVCRNNSPDGPGSAFGAGLRGAGSAVASTLAGLGARPTSAGTGGGASLPSRAGSERIPGIAPAATATTRPTVPHLTCLGDIHR